MGARKQPTPCPPNAVKPKPPPAPPEKRSAFDLPLTVVTFTPRFVTLDDLAELSTLWHLSRTACAGAEWTARTSLRHERLLWVSKAFFDAHPDRLTPTAVYKDLCDMLEFSGN